MVNVKPKEILTGKPLTISVIGGPCSGKSEVSKRIASVYGLVNINLNDLLKEEVDKDTPLALQAKHCLDKGEMLHESIMTKLVRRRMDNPDARFNG